MIRSLIYVRLASKQPLFYTVPLLEQLKRLIPGLTVFEFDNYSEESLRHYAGELLKQSQKAAIVVAADTAEASVAGLGSFLNRLFKTKPPVLLMALQGEQPMLEKMMQTLGGRHFYHNLSPEGLQELLKKGLS